MRADSPSEDLPAEIKADTRWPSCSRAGTSNAVEYRRLPRSTARGATPFFPNVSYHLTSLTRGACQAERDPGVRAVKPKAPG